MDTPETALAPAGGRLIRTHGGLTALLQHWQQHQVHALCPTIDFGALPEQYALVPALVKIDPDPVMADVYFRSDFCKPGEVALTAIGLLRIANCAGISLYTKRTDPRNLPHYWEFQAFASWMGLDGSRQSRTATKEWDLRDGAEQIKGFTPKQISEARKHGARNAETRAINAVIRMLGVKQKYSVEELHKPFGLVRVVFQPDMKDPVQRAVVAQHAMAGSSTMYPTAALSPAPDVIEGHLADEPPAEASRAAPPLDEFDQAPPAEPPAPTPPTRYAITAVQKQPREGSAPLFFVLTEQTGDVRFHTENEDLARAALRAKGRGPIVELELETKAQDGTSWILELRVLDLTTAAPAAKAAVTLPAGACYVEKVEEKKGTNSRGEWTLYTIAFSNGEFGATFSHSIGKTAQEARANRTPVKPTLEDNPQYPDRQNITTLLVVDTKQASFLESEL